MSHYKITRYCFILLSLFAFISSSCKKMPVVSAPVPVTPPKGTIKGVIMPGNAAVKVVGSPAGGGASIDLVGPGGNFTISDLPPGNYTVTVIPKLGYTAPAAVVVTVAGGDTANAGIFNLITNGQSTGYFRFTMDTTSYNLALPDVSCSYASNMLTINATNNPTVPYWAFKMYLANVAGAGTTNLAPLTSSSFIEANNYLPSTTISLSTATYSTDPISPSGSGTVNLSEVNSLTRVVSGTFVAVLRQRGLGVQVKRMTNGSFQLNY